MTIDFDVKQMKIFNYFNHEFVIEKSSKNLEKSLSKTWKQI